MKAGKILAVLFIFFFLVSSVYALGVTPARTTMDFGPGLKRDVSFEIINSEAKDMKLIISAQGELAEYITPSSKEITISSSEESRKISYEVKLPLNLGPGLHTANIVIRELPGEGEISEAYVQATLAVVTQLYVYVPIPGKHAHLI